ncbi:MAG: hypothetical protein KF830_03800 [Planctomycetes bacterium]|nr:hypothetical protein [Planctomycetota bacterium]
MPTLLRATLPLVALATAALPAQVPQHLVVPAAYATNDAISYQWIAGASRPVRQQTLVGASHLTSLVGHALTAIELRRNAANETYQGGTASLTVRLSTSPNQPLACAPIFAANIGADELLVFQGAVTLPTSPPQLGPAVAWTGANTVRIALQTPFLYLGGTLCVDVLGQPVAGQNADWWMADAMFEDLPASASDLGGGCGAYGGPQGKWSHVATRTLVPGGHALFFGYGAPWTIGVAVFGDPLIAGIPMAALGFPSAPACELHLASIVLMSPVLFVPDPNPLLAHRGGRGDVRLAFPNDASFLALTFATQWLEIDQWSVSNAIQWTTPASVPQLDMALLEGDPTEADGELSVHLAHVLRFEYL